MYVAVKMSDKSIVYLRVLIYLINVSLEGDILTLKIVLNFLKFENIFN